MPKNYKCPYCGESYNRADLVSHIEEEHYELLPESSTPTHMVFDIVNGKKPIGNSHGICVVCKRDTPWSDKNNKYQRLCGRTKCNEELRALYSKNMIKIHGTDNMLKDSEQQEKMLAKRKISGKYRFADGGFHIYTGSYEQKALEFIDKVLGFKSTEILSPGPSIEYDYKGEKHQWITDIMIIPFNLIIEVKDGGNNVNNRINDDSRDRTIAKEISVTNLGKYNYLRLTNNSFEQLLETLADIKAQMIDDSEDNKKVIININEEVEALEESTILEMSTTNPLDSDFKKGERLNLSSFKKIPVTEESVKKYKPQLASLCHVRTGEEYKGYIYVDKNDSIVGYIVVHDDGKSKLREIQALEIAKDFRGHGLSKQILMVAINDLKANATTVSKSNEVTLKINKDCGFKTVPMRMSKMYYQTIGGRSIKSIMNESNSVDPKIVDKNIIPVDLKYKMKSGYRLLCINNHRLESAKDLAIKTAFSGILLAPGSIAFAVIMPILSAIFALPMLKKFFAVDIFPVTSDLNKSDADYKAKILACNYGEVIFVYDIGKSTKPKISELNLDHTTGNTIIIRHNNGEYFSLYGHIKPGSISIAVGDIVNKGQKIGVVGNSGKSDTPHLHFELAYTNPESGIAIGKNMSNFENYKCTIANISDGNISNFKDSLRVNKTGELDSACLLTESAISGDAIDTRQFEFIASPGEVNGQRANNAVVRIKGKQYRARVETIIIKDGKIYAQKLDAPNKYGYGCKFPGGGIEPNISVERSAEEECNEEARINVDGLKYTGINYQVDFNGNYPEWHIKKLWPLGLKYEGSLCYIFVGYYDSPYEGIVDAIDYDDLFKHGDFYDMQELDLLPEHIKAIERYNMLECGGLAGGPGGMVGTADLSLVTQYGYKNSESDEVEGYAIQNDLITDNLVTVSKKGKVKKESLDFLNGRKIRMFQYVGENSMTPIINAIGKRAYREFVYEALTGKKLLSDDQILCDECFKEISPVELNESKNSKVQTIFAEYRELLGDPISKFPLMNNMEILEAEKITGSANNIKIFENENGYFAENAITRKRTSYYSSIDKIRIEAIKC